MVTLSDIEAVSHLIELCGFLVRNEHVKTSNDIICDDNWTKTKIPKSIKTVEDLKIIIDNYKIFFKIIQTAINEMEERCRQREDMLKRNKESLKTLKALLDPVLVELQLHEK